MANEVKKVELFGANRDGDAMRFACADGATIAKGTLCRLTSPRTASAQSAGGQIIAGIAAMEKVASDGSTSITLWRNGVFEFVSSGSITAGTNVQSAGATNVVEAYTDTSLANASKVVGVAVANASGNKVQVRVNL